MERGLNLARYRWILAALARLAKEAPIEKTDAALCDDLQVR